MKRILDRALGEVAKPLVGLQAVVLSVAPDGLIPWSWSNDGKHEFALGLVALDCAATSCLEHLGASQASRSLLLKANNTWISSSPLDDVGVCGGGGSGRLFITTLFTGELQGGMVTIYGSWIRRRVGAALSCALSTELVRLRASLVDYVFAAEDVDTALQDLAVAADIGLRRLARLDRLTPDERRRLLHLIRTPLSAS